MVMGLHNFAKRSVPSFHRQQIPLPELGLSAARPIKRKNYFFGRVFCVILTLALVVIIVAETVKLFYIGVQILQGTLFGVDLDERQQKEFCQ